uniref:Peptidase S8/S53 domain-containing protein n=1 Tax=Percolomonas cosmopolitus TaxID=63605 RepID=A0A7S1KSE4_9EUKA
MQNQFAITLEHYIPQNAFLVVISDEMVTKIMAADSVFRVIPFTKGLKFGTGFGEAKMPWGKAKAEDNNEDPDASPLYQLTVSWMKPSEISEAKRSIPLQTHQRMWLNALESSVDAQKLHYDILESSHRMVFTSTDENILDRIAAEAAEHSYVYWVEKTEQLVHTELKFSRPMTSTGTLDDSDFISLGLTGKNQVIGVTDSGVDTNSCFFYDADNAVPFIDAMSDEEPNKSHRKIQSYWSLLDNVDLDHGHGTHVSSIALGKAQSDPLSEFNGVASDAKLVFLDVGCNTPGGCTCHNIEGCPCRSRINGTCPQSAGSMYIPSDFSKHVLGYHHSRGGRVSSFSFGSASSIMSGYSSSSAEIDNYVYNNPDHLILFSAGNSGSINGYSTTTGPTKETKNTIIVGAETAPYESWTDIYTQRVDYEEIALVTSNEWYVTNYCGLYQYVPNHNESVSCAVAKEVAFADNPSAACCDALDSCRISTQEYFGTSLERVENYLDRTCCMTCVEKLLEISPWWRKGSLASFSSVGPTIDGRIKPDLVTIGNRVQAGDANTGTCTSQKAADVNQNVRASQGTSMAAPTAAGAAAVVRQYFEDGFYPSGKANSDNKIAPSAALVKAVLIDSTRPLQDFLRVTTNGVVTPGEMSFQQRKYHEGHGSLNLKNTLQLDGVSKHKLFVSTRSLATGKQHVYTLRIPDSPTHNELSVTLVWTDPGASETASFALVNDLDLLVGANDNGKITEWRGNCDTDEEDSSANVVDRSNNVEKITFTKAVPGATYKIFIRGDHVVTKEEQEYALVISHGGQMDSEVEVSEFIQSPVTSIFQLNSGIFLFTLVILLLLVVCMLSVLNVCSWILVCLFSRKEGRALVQKPELYKPFTDERGL